jgi:hypothetical protein
VDSYNIKIRAIEIPKYLFNTPLIREVVDYKGFKYTIKTIDPPPYGLLYNLLEL